MMEHLWCRHCTDSRGKPKHSYRSEHDAGMALVDAKLKVVFRNNQKRREQRKYPCPVASGWWHLSSIGEAEAAEREAAQARRKALAPYAQALRVTLDGTDLAEHAGVLAELLHDHGWYPPSRREQRAA